eukprot:7320880-Lingulodinium_polyedra.AAC.1
MRLQFWQKQWSAAAPTQRFFDAAAVLKQRAQEEGPPAPLEPTELRSAARCIPKDTAVGLDFVTPTMVVEMPEAGLQELAGLYTECEEEMVLPLQSICNAM